MVQLDARLKKICEEIQQFSVISDLRKAELRVLSDAILERMQVGYVDIVAVCTHNSRRSQLAQLWLKTAALFFQIEGINTFSGGTEGTAFNHRIIWALEQFGFKIIKHHTHLSNPKYIIPLFDGDTTDQMFSKAYTNEYNPLKGFIAVMVCDHADENCPLVFGAKHRVSVHYKDPKEFDGTEEEAQAYLDKVKEIGNEMLWVMNEVNSKS